MSKNEEKLSELEGETYELVRMKDAITEATTISSKNLLNPNDEDILHGNALSSSGNPFSTPKTDYNTSGFIRVEGGESLIYSGCWATKPTIRQYLQAYWYAYDEQKNFITSSFKNVSTEPYTVPSDATFIRCGYQFKSDATGTSLDLMISLSDNWEIYEEYRSGNSYRIKGLPTKVSELENDSNFASSAEIENIIGQISEEKEIQGSANLLNPQEITPDKRISPTTKAEVTQNGENLSGFIKVSVGDKLYVSAKNQNDIRLSIINNSRIYAFADKDNSSLDVDKSFPSRGSGEYYVVPQGIVYVRIGYAYSDVTEVMIKKGDFSNQESYEEYKAGGKVIVPKGLPTKVSELENDKGFASKSEVEELINEAGGIKSRPLALPKTIYGFVGVPIRLYQYNYMQYALDDVYLRVTTSNNGTLLARKWQYTPTSAKTFTNTIRIYSHEMKMLNEESYSIVIKDASAKSSIKCLVIGDSTVNAGHETQKMLDLATEHGYDLTLLGTRGSGTNQHEGRGGWTAKMFVENASNPSGSVINKFYNPSKGEFDFSYYMAQQGYSGVDCVFIQLGINDLFTAKTDAELEALQATFFTNMDKMVASIKSYNSAIKIIINTVIPCQPDQDLFGNGSYDDLQEQGGYGVIQTTWRNRYNVYLSNLKILEHWKDIANVYVSAYGAAIDSHKNMMPDVHPNNDGYNELGEQMYATMRALN